MEFFGLLNTLKHLPRKGWVLSGVQNCETVACHMYRMAMMTFLLGNLNDGDRTRILKMSLVHDLCESIVGDITPHDGVSAEDKHAQEAAAMQRIVQLLPNATQDEVLTLWHEFEAGQSLHARYVKDLDKFDMIQQAFEYEQAQQLDLSGFFRGIQFNTEEVQAWAQALHVQREEFKRTKT